MSRDTDRDSPAQPPRWSPASAGPLPLAERRRLLHQTQPAEPMARQVFDDWAMI